MLSPEVPTSVKSLASEWHLSANLLRCRGAMVVRTLENYAPGHKSVIVWNLEMRTCSSVLVCVIAFADPTTVLAQAPIHLDGEFGDWDTLTAATVSDPTDDATGAFDLSRVSAVVDGKTIYVRFDTQKPLNLQSGPSADGTLRLQIDLNDDRRLVVDLRKRQALLTTSDSTSTMVWRDIRFAALPTYAATDFELRLDLSATGVGEGDDIRLSFEGSDELSESILLTMESGNARTIPPVDTSSPSNSIRLASLNTLNQGCASPERSLSIKKLFDFADADVYCFNEALREDTFRTTCYDVLPAKLAKSNNVHWAATCGIVSRFPLTPLAFKCQEAAALIDLPGDRKLVVVSVHFKCCGFVGSDEDKTRLKEVELLLSDLKRIRNGEFGRDAAKAGVVVLGDFNLVGSRKPLDMVNEAGLKDLMLRSPIDGSAMTWMGITGRESFWPGRLDYATVDTERLRPMGGFVINSEHLDQLRQEPSPTSRASDHSMLVVDIEPL